jgi:hypothetical protein
MFGNFILLGTVLMDAEVSDYRIDYNPARMQAVRLGVCPTGASAWTSTFPPAAHTTIAVHGRIQ